MLPLHQRISKEEFARRGDELFDRVVASRLRSQDADRFVAIDIETGEFEIADDEGAASQGLRARIPAAQTWLRRVGHRSVRHFGGREAVG